MDIENLIVDSVELNTKDSYFIISDLLRDKLISSPKDAQKYIKNHILEERETEIILRNPNFEGIHFLLQK